MKKFEFPEIVICKFNIEDIISSSRDDESDMDTNSLDMLPITEL